MKNDFSLKHHFARNAPIYILSAAIVGVLLSYFIDLKLRARDYEKFAIFVGEYTVETKSFKEKLQKTLGDGIIEIDIYHVEPDSSSYSSSYSTQGYSSDLILIPESSIYQSDVTSFVQIPSDYQKNDDYQVNSVHYGIKMYDGNSGYWTKYISYDKKNYYLFINPKSVHLKGIKDNGKTDSVLKVLKDIRNEI